MRAAGLALLALLLAGCGRAPPGELAAPAGPAPDALRVVRGTLEDRFLLTGELEAVTSQNLTVPQTPAWSVSIRWLAPDGAQVEKGDRVVEFDASSFTSALDDKRLAVVRAEGELTSEAARVKAAVADKEMEVSRRRADLDKAEVEVNVPPDLYSRRLFQEKQLAVDRQRDALAKAEEDLAAHRRAGTLERKVKSLTVTRAERELTELRQRLEDLVLRAPRAGLVQIGLNPREGRKFLVGDQSHPGWPVASMPDLSAMQVRARLHDVDDGTIREGMPAECVLDAYPGRIWKGTLRIVSPIARTDGTRDGTRRFFDVLVALERTDAAVMRPGMSVRIEVMRRRARDVLLVPRVALRASGGKTHVRLGAGGQGDVQAVEIDWCTATTCVVRTGVREGMTLQPGVPAAKERS